MTEIDWLMSDDTGVSSKTIFHVMTGSAAPKWGCDVPHDPGDFGRCYRLLKLFPQWHERLGEVADAYPAWKPLVDAWGELTTLYELDKAPRLYERMRELNAAGYKAAGWTELKPGLAIRFGKRS